MNKNINSDLFTNLKVDIVKLCVSFNMLKQDVVFLLVTNKWILEDINLFENYTKLQKMIDVSDKNLNSLINDTIYLENNSVPFLVDDIICEFNFIRENIDLEMLNFSNMLMYMMLVDDYSLDLEGINELLNFYLKRDEFCYSNMKINNEQLKILKKERGDYFEQD